MTILRNFLWKYEKITNFLTTFLIFSKTFPKKDD